MHSARPQTLLLGLATLAALGLAARPASAQVVVQFNSPITTITSPSANESITLSGLITNFNSTAVAINGLGVGFPISDSASDTISGGIAPTFALGQAFASGTSTPIDLVITYINANQAPGLYNIAPGGGLPTLNLDFDDGETTHTNFAVNVVPAAPAPEPSSIAGLGLGVLGLAGLMLRARQRKPLIV